MLHARLLSRSTALVSTRTTSNSLLLLRLTGQQCARMFGHGHGARAPVDLEKVNAVVNDAVDKANKAAREFQDPKYDQQFVDKIVYEAAMAANQHRVNLAFLAADDTKRGIPEDKIIKNHFSSECAYWYNKYTKTIGPVRVDEASGAMLVYEAIGTLLCVTPVTNPTSTAIFKGLMALKTGNAMLVAPHPSAYNCTRRAVEIMNEAAVRAGAPENILTTIEGPMSVELTQALMKHPGIDLIWATGGPLMVKAALESGRPSIVGGAGNCPAIVDDTADVELAVSSILASKTFDHGMTCAAENSVVVMSSMYDALVTEFEKRGCVKLNKEDAQLMGPYIYDANTGSVNPKIVGKSPYEVASLVPGLLEREPRIRPQTRCILGEATLVGDMEPWSHEKLCPLLGLYKVDSFEEALDTAVKLVNYGGQGHTASLFTKEGDPKKRGLCLQKATGVSNTVINEPSLHGSIGGIFNAGFGVSPTMSLQAGNIGAARRVSVESLVRQRMVVQRREHMLWVRQPNSVFFAEGCLPEALKELRGQAKRAFIVTDAPMRDLGYVQRVTKILAGIGILSEVFDSVKPDPTFSTVLSGVEHMKSFKPDVVIALGGGSPMDAAKVMRLMFVHPEIVSLDSVKTRFMDITKRIFPGQSDEVVSSATSKDGSGGIMRKCPLVCIPTTSGTGSEVTPFAVITDDRTEAGLKHPLVDYFMTPDIAIVDPQLAYTQPRSLLAPASFDAMSHAVESMLSVMASEFTLPMSLQAIHLLNFNMEKALTGDHKALKEVHLGATIAGIGIANAFVGVGHALGHQLGARFHLAHGVCMAIVLPTVVEYNSTDRPRRHSVFPEYTKHEGLDRVARISDHLGLVPQSASKEEKRHAVVERLKVLRKNMGLPATVREAGVPKEVYFAAIPQMAMDAIDDQVIGTNPRAPFLDELKRFLEMIYE